MNNGRIINMLVRAATEALMVHLPRLFAGKDAGGDGPAPPPDPAMRQKMRNIRRLMRWMR